MTGARMDQRAQGKYGSIREIQPYPDGSGIRVARRFLRGIVKDFASWNKDFRECSGLFPVMFRERQISGGLFKAIVHSGARALAEPPIKRKRRGIPEKRGWADFVAYFDDTMWILEVKHTYCTLDCFKKTVNARIISTHLYRSVMGENTPTRPVESGMLERKPVTGGNGCLKWTRKSRFAGPSSSKAKVYARSPGKGTMTGVRSGQPFGMPVLPTTHCQNPG
jgi:hypothetical protein